LISLCLFSFLASTSAFGTASTPPAKTAQWTVFEARFASTSKYQNPFQDVTVTVEFRSPDGKHRTVDAYWDGENVWRVHFSPEQPGEWTYRTYASREEDQGLNNQTGTFRCVPYTGVNILYQHGSVRVSPNGRYLEQSDGTPFFWLSDTAWNGALKADQKSWETYLNDRKKKRFTVVQFVMTQWIAGAGNADLRLAYQGTNSITIDPVFFQWMDEHFQSLNDYGLVAAPVLIWTAPWSPFSKFLNPGDSLPDDQIIRLSRYMVARYGAYQVIWILAGDGDYKSEEGERWKRIGEAVFGENPLRLATIHPGGQQWVGAEFGQEPWFSFIGYQSGHGDTPNDLKWLWQGPPATASDAEPVHPIINLEPNYENHRSFGSDGRFDAHAVRRAAYWSLLVSPPAGITYGAHGVWSWETRPALPMNHPNTYVAQPWFDAINLPGSTDMKYLHELFSSLQWWTLRPDPVLIVTQPGDQDAALFVAAARDENKNWALLYFPVGQTIILRHDELTPTFVRWFNPRSGKWTAAAHLSGGTLSITPPDNQDWVAWIGATPAK
jgi:hypothetical protein